MSFTAAVTFDADFVDDRPVSRRDRRGAPARNFLLRGSILGLGALALIGTSAIAVTLVAGWMTSGIQPQARLLSGPGSLALVPYDQAPKMAARAATQSQWADAYIDRSKPLLPAEKARPVVAEPKATPAPSIARSPAVPLPRPMPARLAQIRAEITQPAPPIAVAKAEPQAAPELPVVVIPPAKPEGASKLDALANLDTNLLAKPDVKAAVAPPKPSPVATIPVLPPTVLPDSVSRTAVYDITGSVVYMPDGSKLEAHSGLGERMDDPRHIRVRMRGPTPPNVYVLTEREALFHGVRAVRLNPVYEDKMFGRDGMLAHTYMLGPNGQSNGCVSFKDYQRFLNAFLAGKVDKMVVVTDLRGTTWKEAAMQADGINASQRRFAGGYSRPTIMPRDRSGDGEPRYTAALGFTSERGAGTW